MRDILDRENVVGIGLGKKTVGGEISDKDVITVLVEKKVHISELDPYDVVPQELNGIETDVMEVGKIVAQLDRAGRYRPAPPGVSIGHYLITAGTFGAVVRDNKTGQKLILSNNHVLANSNDAEIGDKIIQPGSYDGGNTINDVIGTLYRFVPIDFGEGGIPTCPIAKGVAGGLNLLASLIGSGHRLEVIKPQQNENFVDAALALPNFDGDIIDEIVDVGLVRGVYSDPFLGQAVKKSGRTTELTFGSILVTNAVVQVSYGAGKVAVFSDQLIAGPMSQGGDSGSLVLTEENEALGLLFAGSDQTTIFNPISQVMELLDVSFDA